MSNKQPTHDVLLAEDYKDGEGADRAYFTNIGSAWPTENGGMSVKLRDGLAITGRFVILPRKSKDADNA